MSRLSLRILPAQPHCVGSVLRNIVAGEISRCQPLDWNAVSLEDLKTFGAGESSLLDAVPRSWSAADVSCFVAGRPDWGIFLGMFAADAWTENSEPLAVRKVVAVSAMRGKKRRRSAASV